MQNRYRILLLVTGLFLILFGARKLSVGNGGEYNILLVAFDGLQAQHLKSYGYEKNPAPNLEKFLENSYLFRRTVSPASWTVPTYMSVFTGMYPSEHRIVNKFVDFDPASGEGTQANLKRLSPKVVTLAEVLRENGYKTAGFTGDAGVGKTFGYDQGFDEYFETAPFGGFDETADRALAWLDKNKNEKFFLFLHGYDVHGQYDFDYDYRYADPARITAYTGSKEEQRDIREAGLAGDLVLSEEDVAFWRAIYDEKISRADEEFARFLAKAEEAGVLENTVVIVMSDHGTEFYEHKKFDHGHTLYGELVNTLFAIRLPNQSKGVVVRSLVSTLDITPTVLRILGIAHPARAQVSGKDLTPSFRRRDVSRDIFSETDYRLYTHKRSVETPEGWKLILTMETGARELYNTQSDPGERENLAERELVMAERLEKKIQRHLEEMNATGPWVLGCTPVYGDQCK